MRINDTSGDMDMFKRVFYEDTDGYGILCIRCSHTLGPIYYYVHLLPPDTVYVCQCLNNTPAKMIVSN
jgi:hypothetical protein